MSVPHYIDGLADDINSILQGLDERRLSTRHESGVRNAEC